MKNDAERSGADVAPISLTGGTESGSGVVSMRTCWLNLGGNRMVSRGFASGRAGGSPRAGAGGQLGVGGPGRRGGSAYWVCRDAILPVCVGCRGECWRAGGKRALVKLEW